MKTMAIIGGGGMLGSDLVQYFSKRYVVTSINRENYQSHVSNFFDIVINADGNSKRFWANQNPVEDFFVSTASVMRSVFDFPCGMYIYISSPDVYENHTEPKYTKENVSVNPKKLEAYGLHKYLAELIVKKYKENFLILRSSMILGPNLKKGPIYDIINGSDLFITLDSGLQLVTTFALAEVIETLMKGSIKNEVVNVGGVGTFSFLNVERFFKKGVRISPKARAQRYEMNINKLKRLYPPLKSSQEYLQEFLTNLPGG